MIVGLFVISDVVDVQEEFVTVPVTKKRQAVQYDATIDKLRHLSVDITGLIVPHIVPDTDYDVEYFIEHIRIDYDQGIARLPIVVYVASEDDYCALVDSRDKFKGAWYEKIGVVVSDSPTLEDLEAQIDDYAWGLYQSQAALEPRYSVGRHDKANVWGARSVVKALSAAYGPESTYCSDIRELERALLEDTYYKRKIFESQADVVDSNKLVILRREREKLLRQLGGQGRVLVVEDQLEDGWEMAYKAVFSVQDSSIELVFADNYERAIGLFDVDLDLILLDVRLAPDRESECQLEGDSSIEKLSGVRLARRFRERSPSAPIIAATASNKAWTLEALLGHGLNGYWVKESPDISGGLNHALTNLIEFYRKLNQVLEWSAVVRPWIESIYRIAKTIKQVDMKIGVAVEEKARSFHALLHQAFSPFSKELSGGLQYDVAFLIVYSLINEIIDWTCQLRESSSRNERELVTDYGGVEILILKEDRSNRTYMLWTELSRALNLKSREDKCSQFPDALILKYLLHLTGLKECVADYDRLKDKRNHIALTHGKYTLEDRRGKRVDNASNQDISDLVSIYSDLVENFAEPVTG